MSGPNRNGVFFGGGAGRGPGQRVRSCMFFPLDPRPDEVFVRDIAFALSNEVRWAGHVGPLSVAQHAFAVSSLSSRLASEAKLPPCEIMAAARIGLHHDDAEAYLKDIPRPLKIALPVYGEIEARVHDTIMESLGLPTGELPAIVKQADEDMITTEATFFFGAAEVRAWNLKGTVRPEFFNGRIWYHALAEKMFLERHAALGLPLLH